MPATPKNSNDYTDPKAQGNDQPSQGNDQAPQSDNPDEVARAQLAQDSAALPDNPYHPMPAGGLAALADQLYPDDRDNQEKRQAHIHDLFILNRDTLRTEDSYTAGQLVRVK